MRINSSAVPPAQDKSNALFYFNQKDEALFRNLANPEGVSQELSYELSVIRSIILNAIKETEERRLNNPNKYMDSRYFSQDLNATIKGLLLTEISKDPKLKIVAKSSYGSTFFVIRGSYLVYIKKLNSLGKPSYVSTPRSNNLMNQLTLGESFGSIPILFIGPKFKGLEFQDVHVTSLISKKEVNWCLEVEFLLDSAVVTMPEVEEKDSFDNLRVKESKIRRKSN